MWCRSSRKCATSVRGALHDQAERNRERCVQTFYTWPLPIGPQRETYVECQTPTLCMERDENTFDTHERPEPCTPTLAPRFQHEILHAIVVLSNTGDRTLNSCLCSRQAKRCFTGRYSITLISSMWIEKEKDIPRESQKPDTAVLF
jgi:hypothetical protein